MAAEVGARDRLGFIRPERERDCLALERLRGMEQQIRPQRQGFGRRGKLERFRAVEEARLTQQVDA
jgi:hypothetical protein